MTVEEHYEKHLASFYTWMLGDFTLKQQEQEVFFRDNVILPTSTKVALDLGAGNGLQAISLAKLGFKVKAIDFNTQLLEELKSNSLNLSIEVIKDNIKNLAPYNDSKPELIGCFGDTLTHLESFEEVSQLIKSAYNILVPKGKLILSFRDYSQELLDTNRFIPVKSDENRILTCFLEYFPSYIRVTDILHEKNNCLWEQKISSYHKLRLDIQEVKIELEKLFSKVEVLDFNRMKTFIAIKG